jgi:predicted DNA-binding protein YlxM (UPF0122 family)
MDEKLIIKMYVEDDMSLREIAKELNTNHKLIGRIIKRNGIKITKRNKLRVFTDEHKKKISESRKKLFKEGKIIPYNKGLKTKDLITKNGVSGNIILLNNMKKHLRVDVDLDWFIQFENIEKLKFLNKSITRKRDFGNYDKKFYISFIEKFYYNKKFNNIYDNWLNNNKNPNLKPSVDHIIPKSKGGVLFDINNLQFLTWLENRCKNNISQKEWEDIKKNINKYFI